MHCEHFMANFSSDRPCEANLRIAMELCEKINERGSLIGLRSAPLDRLFICGACEHGRAVIHHCTGINSEEVIRTAISYIREAWARSDRLCIEASLYVEDKPKPTSTRRYNEWLKKGDNLKKRQEYQRKWEKDHRRNRPTMELH